MGMRVGLPLQTAEGIMFFQVDDCTLRATQILELLDKNQLNRQGIRTFAQAQKNDSIKVAMEHIALIIMGVQQFHVRLHDLEGYA